MNNNNRLRLDTTMLQSNTAHHLIQYITEQRKAILKLLKSGKLTDKMIRELQSDFEFICIKHMEAVHKRMGTKVYPRKEIDYKISEILRTEEE